VQLYKKEYGGQALTKVVPNNSSSTAVPSGQTIVQIQTGQHWSGSILDSSVTSITHDGLGYRDIPMKCDKGGIFSVVFQKEDDYGTLTVSVVQDGKVLKTGTTNAAYGLVSLAGTC
jgi:hypothetical protein